jgi:hypothetical protein
MASVYRWGNGFALRGGGRTVTRIPRALLALTCALFLTSAGAMAQPANPPAEQPASQPAPADSASDTASNSDADKNAQIAAARQQQRTTAATRQQIQAIRAALRARLAAMHH